MESEPRRPSKAESNKIGKLAKELDKLIADLYEAYEGDTLEVLIDALEEEDSEALWGLYEHFDLYLL
jgi:hypothetical protein